MRVSHSAKTPFLHVANGTCTTRLIKAAGIPGALSIWADPLHEGPVPAGLTDAKLLEVRARYLGQATTPATYIAQAESDASADATDDLREWRAVIRAHESYGELLLWFEHDLFDQLNLIQLLTWIREHVPASKPVTLVCIGSFPGRPHFKGLGQLTPDQLASLLDARQPVSDAQYALAERAWRALREPTPAALDDIRRRDTSALPYLAAAITRFLQEYPWTRDGLSRTERRFLELADRGITLSNAFPRMHDDEDAYYITDTSIAVLAENLSRTSPPLVTLALSDAKSSDALRGSVTLTEMGRAILDERQDRVAKCGIDRWLGGVHLQTPTNVWRWNDERQRIVKD
jgi:hypothetical protein